ncbi:flavin-containing monooxygenase [Mycobacterium sp. PDNC021]|uniref:flavin-containing monooxygenase n=1 Tax=Mycobacterium sp. PDNC021 TaxID=3391399 RepID=UPI003AAD76ED
MASPTTNDPTIVIIGAGIAGITAAITFKRAGFDRFVILEKGSDVGGVWHWNRYPGIACDVPSFVYQFSFALKPDWSRIWSDGDEIQRYHRDVVDRFGLREHLRLNAEVVAAEFCDPDWKITLADGTSLTADFVVAATGVLHHPFIPDIPGLSDFQGAVVHSARWDDSVETSRRKIAVIGSGSTAVQLVSALQPEAAHLTQFSRSPQWVMWAPTDLLQSRLMTRILASAPLVNRKLHDAGLWATGLLADVVLRPTWRRRLVQRFARWSLRAQIHDKELRRKLTPDYQPLCKRQVLSGTYYQAIAAPNAKLVTDSITHITESGVATADGAHHNVDTIVLATGFHPHNYMRPMNLRGRAGVTIDEAWVNGPRAYRMTAIPGFPNLFTVLGPNSPTGSISLQYSAELTAQYITHWLRKFRDGQLLTVEVTEEATERFNDAVVSAMGPTVWNTGCNSWYFTDQKTIDLWPFDRKAMCRMLEKPDERDFIVKHDAQTTVYR